MTTLRKESISLESVVVPSDLKKIEQRDLITAQLDNLFEEVNKQRITQRKNKFDSKQKP